MSDTIKFTLDGKQVTAEAGETIWQVAKRHGTTIPHLCWKDAPGYRADGNCRACMVEIEGGRVLAASCLRKPIEGMAVHSASERAEAARRMAMELLVADQPARESAHGRNSCLWQWAERLGVRESRFPARTAPAPDASHPAMRVALDACIHCNLCVRACREVQVNDVIGMAYGGAWSKIVFDQDDLLGGSTCVASGECVQACPTGALMEATRVDAQGVGNTAPLAQVDSVCPFCGVGCLLTYRIAHTRIVSVKGRNGPANENRLCVKGRFGFDYIDSPERLKMPLIRRAAVLDALEPEAVASLSPGDMVRMNIEPGAMVKVSTRRGEVELRARADSAVPSGMVFIPFCYAEAPANVLTNQALDPYGKVPEFNFCAARVRAV